ncbi:hypothetical protein T4B_6956 [Trichinella pseudospiralis]|uniref:Uncharacterized protein n=1 Tax=Trichinella pseudospiralis TaxID=6337 RepID=A0A0V1IH19_TRIPS|nr:hypothetical protein T4A_5575 [Trichinella pseudospiralis]KRZ22047.1 hypothetical protein T4B_6956 [Trichinella pseudospiralis]KRZ28167.1 hypothetical protein T4C_5527 [Trichinella pseudospiralis]
MNIAIIITLLTSFRQRKDENYTTVNNKDICFASVCDGELLKNNPSSNFAVDAIAAEITIFCYFCLTRYAWGSVLQLWSN